MTAHTQPSEAASLERSDLATYVRDITRYPLLSSSEELEVAQQLSTARQLYVREMLQDPAVQRQCYLSVLTVYRGDCRIDSVIDVSVSDKEKTRAARQLIEAKLPELADALPSSDVELHDETVVDLLKGMHLRLALVTRHWEEVGQPCSHVERLRSQMLKIQQKLVRHNLRLVLSIANKYQPVGSSLLDLVQDGNLGLMIAAEKFDAERGHRFSTYATWWIRELIQRGIRASGRTIRVTDAGREFRLRFNRRTEELRQRSGYLNCELIDHELSLSMEDRQALRAMQPIVSLNSLLVGDDPIVQFQRDRNVTTPLEQMSRTDTVRNVHESLANQEDRDREVIMMRFGLGGRDEHTFDRIAETLSMSRQGVAKITKRVLSNLASQLGALGDS